MAGGLVLGAVADDLTGATDLANTLVKEGMPSIQLVGVPDGDALPGAAAAVVIALKTRTAPAEEATAQALRAARWLCAQGARMLFFKYCSTFDSTDRGNIGPVAEALMEALDIPFTIACPAFPENARTVFRGHLFVGDTLLSESPMRHHPLTPMTDANLVRVLARQCRGRVGLVPYEVVDRGPERIAAEMRRLAAEDVRIAIVDALNERHLRAIGEAAAELGLITGGSGAALGLPDAFRRRGVLAPHAPEAPWPTAQGAGAVIAGSCSPATLGQIEAARGRWPVRALAPLELGPDGAEVGRALAWAKTNLGPAPIVVHASAPPEQVREVQERLGREEAGRRIEAALAEIARGLVAMGVRRLVVAGGETAGAVVAALGLGALRIGPEIDPGVPWTLSIGEPPLYLALKSGNFGAPDFFTKAFAVLP